MAIMALTTLLACVIFTVAASASVGGDDTCESGHACETDTPKQEDISVLFQSKNAQVLTASMPSNDAPIITADQTKVFVRPIVQKLAEMNATMTTLKALSVATPEVNTVVNGMIVSINTNIKPHIITDHTDTQTLVDTTVSTLSTRTTVAVEGKVAAVAADKAMGQCYATQRSLLVLHETCKVEEATLKKEKEEICALVYPTKTYSVPDELKKDLTCDFSKGPCTSVRDARKLAHDTWANGLSIGADKASYDSAHAACAAATLLWTNKIASCQTMWTNFQSKHAHCMYALKAQQLAICMFGNNLQLKCETKSKYDTLIDDIAGSDNSDSTVDRASEWIAVNQLECMLTKFVGGAIFDNAMIADCTKNEADAKDDFELHVGIIDKKTVEYESLITEANFNCAETAITFTGDRWSVPQDVLETHVSSAYTMVTGYEYAFDSDSDNAPFDFCASKSAHTTCGAIFACGSGSRKPAETTCYVDGGCTAAACCVKVAVCGDHVLDANEECDDGNTVAEDGCSNTCTLDLAEDGADGTGWSNTMVTTLGSAGAVHGPWGHDIKEVSKTFAVGANSLCQVKWRSWSIFSRDGEHDSLYLDGVKVWEKRAHTNELQAGGWTVWTTAVPDFNAISSTHRGYPSGYYDGAVTVSCSGTIAVEFKSTIDQPSTDEAWAFSDFEIIVTPSR